jgi:hypothetical protein
VKTNLTTTSLSLALVHYPTVNKQGAKVCTSVTNLDIHDIARTCRTFGFKHYFLVTPLQLQTELIARILNYWETDKAGAYNPDRFDALSIAKVVPSLEAARDYVTQSEGKSPILAATGANFLKAGQNVEVNAPSEYIAKCQEQASPGLVVFGTGYGLHAEALELCDLRLAPILGHANDGYNHLSVRSAAALYAFLLTERSLLNSKGEKVL